MAFTSKKVPRNQKALLYHIAKLEPCHVTVLIQASGIKKPIVYITLKTMRERGYVEVTHEMSDSNRFRRKRMVFSLSATGREAHVTGMRPERMRHR